MSEADLVALVERYFRAVDEEDLDALLATLAPGCAFTVETHGVRLEGHEAIAEMFRRLWADHAAVSHLGFVHVPHAAGGRIATRFRVENTERDGSITRKSNANIFEVADGRFTHVAVYMTGANTLTAG